MNPIHPRLDTVLAEALELSTPEARAAYLDQACVGDAELRRQVADLLAAHEQAGSFLEKPAADPNQTGEYTPASEHPTPGHFPEAEGRGTGIGRYQLRERLGEGGMGTVWLAEQTEPVVRQVALKLIKPGLDSRQVLARFEAERQALALMDHPHIAKVFDGGATPDGRPYFVMELVQGIPITKFCDQERLTLQERLELFLPVCQAVQHAHQKGIIHRDLKPSNVLVAFYDGKPVPKVIDFGVAKATGRQLTKQSVFTEVGAVIGTLEYMAPEQAELNNHDIDTRADIYALGVILYELLAGSLPFTSQELRQQAFSAMLRMIREVEPAKPSTKLSSSEALPSIAAQRKLEPKKLTHLVQGDLDWIVMKCLEKERSRRYETANQLAQEIQRYLADEPVLAGPPRVGYRLKKFVRRHRGPVAAATGILLTLVVGLAVSLWQMNRALEAEGLAKTNEDKAIQLAVAEKQQREAAQNRLLQVEKGADLLFTIFLDFDIHKVRPGKEPMEVVLGKRLKQAAQQLRGSAIGDPLVVAKVQSALGFALHGLGYVAEAIPLLEESSTTHEAQLGLDHLRTLKTMNILAVAYKDTRQLAKAFALLEKVLATQVKHLGATHEETLVTSNNLAETYRETGQHAQAILLLKQTHEALEQQFGASDPRALIALHNLAGCYRDTEQLERAILLYEQVQAAETKVLGADHPDTLTTLGNLAIAYRRAGQRDRAVLLLEKVRDGMVKRLGADHPDTWTAQHLLAGAYRDNGQFAKALPLFEQVRSAFSQHLGAEHPQTLKVLGDFARGYLSVGQPEKALPLLEQACAGMQKTLGADHPVTLNTLGDLATAYTNTKQVRRAIPLYEQIREVQVKKLGAQHQDYLVTLANLAFAYQVDGQLAKALALFTELVQSIEKQQFQHPYADRFLRALWQCHEQMKQFDRAEVWRHKWLAIVKAKNGPQSTAYADELFPLGLNLLHQKKYPDAEAMLRECLAIREKKEPEAVTTFASKFLLGEALLGQKKFSKAELYLTQGYEGMKQRAAQISPQGKTRQLEAIERVVQLYDTTGKKEEAAKWKKELDMWRNAQPAGKP